MATRAFSGPAARFALTGVVALLLAACRNDGVVDEAHPAGSELAAESAEAIPGVATLTLEGTPAATVKAGSAYSFVPSASNPSQQPLGFSISNKPAWASFNASTGTLTGVPGANDVGTIDGIQISASNGVEHASLPAFSITVSNVASGAPTISGSPATAVSAGKSYAFTPMASDAEGDSLTFSISAKPAWALFSAATGTLSGTPGPSDQGSFANITITVSDGKNTATLTPFSILVSPASSASATLAWTPPTQNTDGSSLTNLAGYRIYYGTDSESLASSIQVTNPGLTSYTVGNLSSGTYYFSIAAYTADGVEGSRSAVGSKTL